MAISLGYYRGEIRLIIQKIKKKSKSYRKRQQDKSIIEKKTQMTLSFKFINQAISYNQAPRFSPGPTAIVDQIMDLGYCNSNKINQGTYD